MRKGYAMVNSESDRLRHYERLSKGGEQEAPFGVNCSCKISAEKIGYERFYVW